MATIGAPVQDGMIEVQGDLFGGAEALYIKQEMAAIEMFGCEAKQRYRISVPKQEEADSPYKEGDVFLYISEESNCMLRLCCGPNRPLKLIVHQGQDKTGPTVMTMQKPFHLQGCCCLRPSFEVVANNKIIGRVEDPWRCCYMDQQIKDANGTLMLATGGSPWQCGAFCPCCYGITFKVTKKDGQKCGEITKMKADCSEMCCGTNRFMINMISVPDETERKMLLASAMLLDLQYFETQK